MTNTAHALVEMVRGMLAEGGRGMEGDAGAGDGNPWSDGAQRTIARQMFEMAAGAPCPPGFDDALLLPDEVRVRWRDGDVVGELAITHPQLSLEHRLDDSLHATVINGTPLGTLCIIDRVVDTAGPFYTCWRPDDAAPGRLYLFDLRDLEVLDCTLDAYLDAARVSRGVTFWQQLFAPGKLTPERAGTLTFELAWLEANAPAPALATLRMRLNDRA
jgi:hypothetical protein